MKKRLGVIMDPISSIKPYKDTTLALLLAAQEFEFEILYMELSHLSVLDGSALADTRMIKLFDSNDKWFEFLDDGPSSTKLSDIDCIIMRKDPPFDMEYVFATYILELAQSQGAFVVNNPRSIRDCNEKLFTAWFPELCPPTLVTRSHNQLRGFLELHNDIVVKPLDGMGGTSVFRIKPDDSNAGVIFETLTKLESNYCMAQKYLPAILEGDKRVLMVNGKPIPFSLARIPAAGELRGNLAAGGRGVPRPLSESDLKICTRVSEELVQRGLLFVGLDIIGDRLTEINVTSPTCAREIDLNLDKSVGTIFMEALKSHLQV
ncbi:MAG: glutathione synthase [Gammaproteobacteria bacterium]